MSQPLYAELFELYSNHRNQHRDYFWRGNQAASLIASSLFAALGLPEETFATDDGPRPWVQLYNYNENETVEEATWSKLANWDGEGRLQFAVGVALSSAINSYPKSYFWIGYTLRIEEDRVLVSEVHGERQTFDISSDDGLNALVGAYFATLRKSLQQSPKDAFKAKRGIGFF